MLRLHGWQYRQLGSPARTILERLQENGTVAMDE
jgi:hypothetical protein